MTKVSTALPPVARLVRRLREPTSFASRDMMPATLYHYTTAAGFEGILLRRHMRATNFSFLNDPSEVEYGRALVTSEVAGQEKRREGIEKFFCRRILENLNTEALAEVYVCCFTGLEDDLSQWRAYGSAVLTRYAIGFDPEALQELAAKPAQIRFEQVEYERDDQITRVRFILDRALEFVQQENFTERNIEPIADLTARRLNRLCPALKSPAYRAEQEWRVVINASRHATAGVEFDTSRGVMRPFMKFKFPQDQPVPIKSVVVLAPGRREAALKAADLLLRKLKIRNVLLRPSDVPFAE